MSAGYELLPKPEGSHFIQIHYCYLDIIPKGPKGKPDQGAAAILSALEYLAKSTYEGSKSFDPLNPPPSSIRIRKNCNSPLLIQLTCGIVKTTSVKKKLAILEECGFIKVEIVGGKDRIITFRRAAVAKALARWSKSDPSENDDLTRQNLTSQNLTSQKSPGNPSENDDLTRQKTTTTRYITKYSRSNSPLPPDNAEAELRESEVEQTQSVEQLTPASEASPPPSQRTPRKKQQIQFADPFLPTVLGVRVGSPEFLEERPWIQEWRGRRARQYNPGFLEYLNKTFADRDWHKGTPDSISYLGKANHQDRDAAERLPAIEGHWKVFQSRQKSQSPQESIAYTYDRTKVF